MHALGAPVVRHLRGRGDAHHLATLVVTPLAVPELVLARDVDLAVEVMRGDRRRRHPFEAARVPGIRTHRRCPSGTTPAEPDVPEQHGHADGDDESTGGRNGVPQVESGVGGIAVDAARHALKTEYVHRPERQVEADEQHPEPDLAQTLVQFVAERLRPPEVETRQHPHQGTAEDHVMEVGDDVVGVGLLRVGRRDGMGDTGEPADGEHRHRPDGVQHRRGEPNPAPPHSGQPVEDLHAGGDGDEHRGK